MVDSGVPTDSRCGDAEGPAVTLSRRQFLAGAAGITAALTLEGDNRLAAQAIAGAGATTLLDPTASGIEHVVVVMMERHSHTGQRGGPCVAASLTLHGKPA
jgi:hypothetical protein